MITEDYVSFEIAKLLKEKGFPLPSTNFRDWLCCMYDKNGNIHWGSYDKNWYFRITHQMAMKWLRDKGVRICPDYSDVDGKWFTMIGTKKKRTYSGYYDSYEEAIEAALKYSLENLL